MSYGIRTYDALGNLAFDSESRAFTMYDVFTIPRRTNGSKGYPQLAGYTVEVNAVINTDLVGIAGNTPYMFSVSYSSGYPIVSWTYVQAYANAGLNYPEMLVFTIIKTTPATSTYGFKVINGESELTSSDFSKNYAYIGDATLISSNTTNPYTDAVFEYSINSSAPPIPFVQNIEGQLAVTTRIRLVSGSWRIRVVGSTSTAPRVLCFAPIASAGSGYGMQVFSSSGELEFDSTKKIVYAYSFSDYLIPPTGYNNNTVFFRMLQTTSLTTTGSIPSNPASFCPMQGFHGAQVNSGGNIYIKHFYGGIKKQGGVMYSGWVTDFWSSSPFPTYFPITTQSGLTRVYSIDANMY